MTEYRVALNAELFAGFRSSLEGTRTELHALNFKHPLLQVMEEPTEVLDTAMPPGLLSVIFGMVEKTEEGGMVLPIRVSEKNWALPDLDKPLNFPAGEFNNAVEYRGHFPTENRRILTQAMVGPGQLLRDELRKFRYLGPIRKRPPRNFVPLKTPTEGRWANGLAAWDRLHSGSKDLFEKTSDWLSHEDRLHAGYALMMSEYKELEVDGAAHLAIKEGRMLDQAEAIAEEVNRLPTKRRLSLMEEGSLLEVFPQDVGEGISQLLPVVVLALDLDEGIAAIEQPELHVHPAVQVGLGDLFASQIKAGERIFLLETHSEHLMLRLLRRIEETSNDDLPPGQT